MTGYWFLWPDIGFYDQWDMPVAVLGLLTGLVYHRLFDFIFPLRLNQACKRSSFSSTVFIFSNAPLVQNCHCNLNAEHKLRHISNSYRKCPSEVCKWNEQVTNDSTTKKTWWVFHKCWGDNVNGESTDLALLGISLSFTSCCAIIPDCKHCSYFETETKVFLF